MWSCTLTILFLTLLIANKIYVQNKAFQIKASRYKLAFKIKRRNVTLNTDYIERFCGLPDLYMGSKDYYFVFIDKKHHRSDSVLKGNISTG